MPDCPLHDIRRIAGNAHRSETRPSSCGHHKVTNMPYVNIKVTREGTAPGAEATTPEQKRALIKGVSDLLFDIDEVELENWGVGGLTTPEYRRQQAAKST
jgi:4-oxalocrotonate tautomerase